MAEDFTGGLPQYTVPSTVKAGTTKYEHLLAVLEELGKDIKPTYTGNKICSERLKKNIIQARLIVREVLSEVSKEREKATAEVLAKLQ